MTNQELLKRIEKLEALTKRLEQAVQDIWSACSCLAVPEPEREDIILCELPEPEIEEEELPPEDIIE